MRLDKTARGIICIMAFFGMGMLFGCGNKQGETTVTTYEGTLESFSYHPGYSDMDGAYHHEYLKKNEDGTWVIESNDRSEIGEPTIVTTYAVSSDAVAEFETFLKQKRVLTLENRKDSDEFVTDYSAWSISFTFSLEKDGKTEKESHRIEEYKKYYDADRKIIREILDHFKALRGELISTVEEKD
ncbi:MAG: hypothetical protein J6S81_02890 [Treponema sp.]|nr:hypothetical protein [Treponema sp.]